MKKHSYAALLAISIIFSQCDTLKKIPTNTTGGVFSLNGNWKLETTNDNNALVGTIVTVFPGITDATVRTLSNNTHCLRERDILWRSLKSQSAGGFTLENLVDACNNSTVYRTAVIAVLNNDEIRVTGQKDVGGELVQTWKRVYN